VSEELSFRTDLYRGTAPFYDRYRAPYPKELLDDLVSRVQTSGRGRLLDLACGTGQVALPLAEHFTEVLALDQEAETVEYGKSRSRTGGVTNLTWITGAAEEVNVDGAFELITIGNAFHRVDRQVVAGRIYSWLQPGGSVALLWGGLPFPGDLPWQDAIAGLFRDWIHKAGTDDRIPPGWEAAMERDPHAVVLERSGLQFAGHFEFTVPQVWTLESLAGFIYSTSILNRTALGDRVAEFEMELAERLLRCEPSGNFELTASYSYDLARKGT
jgi:SAM-dependent methyltransferase